MTQDKKQINIELVYERIGNNTKALEEIKKLVWEIRDNAVNYATKEELENVELKLLAETVSKRTQEPINKLVIGAVGVILIAVATAIVNGVVK